MLLGRTECASDAIVARLVQACTQLEVVDLSWSPASLTDVGVRALLTQLPALRVLSLEGCKGVTEVLPAVSACPYASQLSSLDLSWMNCASAEVQCA